MDFFLDSRAAKRECELLGNELISLNNVSSINWFPFFFYLFLYSFRYAVMSLWNHRAHINNKIKMEWNDPIFGVYLVLRLWFWLFSIVSRFAWKIEFLNDLSYLLSEGENKEEETLLCFIMSCPARRFPHAWKFSLFSFCYILFIK